jgi:predicted CXXCH cytochrome family protein
MNETLKTNKMTQGAFNMKKMLFVAVVAIAVLAVATSAFASFYVSWNAAYNTGLGALGTPHKDYRVNTVKCAVCHSVHDADVTGELLLKSTIADACTYCHIETSIGGKQIYNADAAAYEGPDTNYAHNALYGYSCSSCHSVHGAGTWNFSNTSGGVGWIGDVNSKILRMYEDGDEHEAWGGAGDAGAPAGYGRDDAYTRDMAVTAFCTQCHSPYFAQDSQTQGDFSHSATPNYGYSHPMVRDTSLATFSPALKAGSTVAYNGQVAWKNSEACRSCHDAGIVDGSGVILSSFPHYTPGAERFLMAATSADGPMVSATDGTWDGVCLKCHVAGSSLASLGVGINF